MSFAVVSPSRLLSSQCLTSLSAPDKRYSSLKILLKPFSLMPSLNLPHPNPEWVSFLCTALPPCTLITDGLAYLPPKTVNILKIILFTFCLFLAMWHVGS